MMKKRAFFLLWCTSLLLTLISCTPKENNEPMQNAAIKGTVIGLEGTVLINGEEAQLNGIVSDGAVIATKGDGYCEITFLGSNIIKIFEDSVMKVSFKEAMISVEKGAGAAVLRNIQSLLQKDDDLFHVESGNVVAGIRGTSFYLKKEDPETIYFCLCNGAIDISDPQGELEIPLQATHHNALRIRDRKGEVSIISRASLEYHSDEEMEALAAKIGQTIDWTRQE